MVWIALGLTLITVVLALVVLYFWNQASYYREHEKIRRDIIRLNHEIREIQEKSITPYEILLTLYREED
jgi:alpha-N-acetylglucosamine transferase